MKSVSLRQLDSFFSKFTPLTYRKGELILKAGQNPAGVYYLRKGLVRQYALSARGEALVIHVYRPGTFFPMTWAINHTANAFYFAAMTQVAMFQVPVKEVRLLLQKQPEILFDFTSRLLLGVSGLLSRLEQLVLESAYTRVASLLTYFGKKFGVKQGRDVVLPVVLTHRDIAAWVGTTRETASLQVEALKQKRIVQYRGRTLVIKNFKKLQTEARANL